MSNVVDSNNRDYILALGLSVGEFKCKCSREECHYFIANQLLLESYAKFRSEYNKAIKINSGFRCQAHNKAIEGASKSKHTLGRALDLSTRHMTKVQKKEFADLARCHFPFVLEYPSFIHVDVDLRG